MLRYVTKAKLICTDKSLSEVLIYSPINPQYDNRLFHELRVQYEKITTSEHVKNMLCTQIGLLLWTQITPRGWIFWTMIFYNLEKFTSRSI